MLLLLVATTAACDVGPAATPVTSTAERDGLVLRVALWGAAESLVVETELANRRPDAAYLVPDQCGRVTEAVLARTILQPVGRAWFGSLGAVKDLVLRGQESAQRPDRFHPRRPGDPSSEVPECRRPERPVELGPGEAIDERWQLPLAYAYSLDAVGSEGTVVRVEAVEARGPDELEYLDILAPGSADEVRAGRSLRVDEAASRVVERPAKDGAGGASLGELFDRLVEDAALRAWIEAQPADSWRHASLGRQPDGSLELRAVTTAFERAALAGVRPDGQVASLRLPTEADRTRTFPLRGATLPPGVPIIREPEAYELTEDMVVGEVRLPTGRVIVGEYLFDAQPLDLRVAPGAYPAHVTLARHPESDFDTVALSTLVLSDEPTARWVEAPAIAVDGGTASITSPEGVALLTALFERDEPAWTRRLEVDFDSLIAHDYLATEVTVDGEVNLVMSASGVGDGGYPVFVGFDASGRPTRVVIDFLLAHFDWPVPEASG